MLVDAYRCTFAYILYDLAIKISEKEIINWGNVSLLCSADFVVTLFWHLIFLAHEVVLDVEIENFKCPNRLLCVVILIVALFFSDPDSDLLNGDDRGRRGGLLGQVFWLDLRNSGF